MFIGVGVNKKYTNCRFTIYMLIYMYMALERPVI